MTLALLLSCGPSGVCDSTGAVLDGDDVDAFINDPAWRCAVLERDLVQKDNTYADLRFQMVGRGDQGWDVLPAMAWPSRALSRDDASALERGEALLLGEVSDLVPSTLPTTTEGWVALGERVFFEYPTSVAPLFEEVAAEGALEEVGFLVRDDAFIGLRVFENEGEVVVGATCAQCHASRDSEGDITGVRANRAMDVGQIRLISSGALGREMDNTRNRELADLGPGRADVLDDGTFNPYALPDWGGLGDMPFLHHNANWNQNGVATLALRCETLFITATGEKSRIPRELAWALSHYIHSLPAPAPVRQPDEASALGEVVFNEQGCPACHTPPLYTSSERIPLERVGTDPSAAQSPVRGSIGYRVPSLRGVGGNGPYLHDGSVPTLDAYFSRTSSAHPFGQGLEPEDRQNLIAWLESI